MQILKHEWPSKWTSFIPDIVAASKTSETLCENSMVILKLLSEEVFDFSRGELTQVRAPQYSPGVPPRASPSLSLTLSLSLSLSLYLSFTTQRMNNGH